MCEARPNVLSQLSRTGRAELAVEIAVVPGLNMPIYESCKLAFYA